MKIKSAFFLLLLFTFGFAACDKIEPPYTESSEPNNDTIAVRKFLLEEFTGHLCPNCPEGAAMAQQLKSLYGDRLVFIAIHASSEFAEPYPPIFPEDFRTATGNELFSFFPPSGFPSGMISRTSWPTEIVIDKDSWGPRIESLKALKADFEIELSVDYNSANRNVDVIADIVTLSDLDGTYKIAAYITEDSIQAAQLTQNDPENPDNIINDFYHRHVLRASMNGTFGDTLSSGPVNASTQFEKNFSYILSSSWSENHCYVVVFVYNTETYEIMQVEESRVN